MKRKEINEENVINFYFFCSSLGKVYFLWSVCSWKNEWGPNIWWRNAILAGRIEGDFMVSVRWVCVCECVFVHILCMRNGCTGSSIADLGFLLRTSAIHLIITAAAPPLAISISNCSSHETFQIYITATII